MVVRIPHSNRVRVGVVFSLCPMDSVHPGGAVGGASVVTISARPVLSLLVIHLGGGEGR